LEEFLDFDELEIRDDNKKEEDREDRGHSKSLSDLDVRKETEEIVLERRGTAPVARETFSPSSRRTLTQVRYGGVSCFCFQRKLILFFFFF